MPIREVPYGLQLAERASELATLCVHSGDERDPVSHALEAPIVVSNAFEFDSADEAAGAFQLENDAYIYGRWRNPTVFALEKKVASLEGAEEACATASGMAAISGTILTLCEQGSHIVAPRSMYAESARLFRERLPRYGIRTTFVDAVSVESYASAISPETRILYIETPANPNLAVTNLAAVVGLAKGRGLVTVADNTFATPFCQTPLKLGVDLVIHSMTKALSGHGDVIGGVVVGRSSDITKIRELIIKGFGGALSPLSAFLITRGIRTFALRQRQACETAAALAAHLSEHPAIERVNHPSLRAHPGHELAVAQMHAYGSLLSFEVKSSKGRSAIDSGRRVLEGVKLIRHAVSLGDVRTLLVHPASTTHSTMPKEMRELAHISDGLLRLSVGIESAQDLWNDLAEALSI